MSRPSNAFLTDRLLIGIIAEKETTIGFLLAGIGETNITGTFKNFLMVTEETTTEQIEQFFNALYQRKDLCVILIGADVAQRISKTLDNAAKLIPVIIEIPTKDYVHNDEMPHAVSGDDDETEE